MHSLSKRWYREASPVMSLSKQSYVQVQVHLLYWPLLYFHGLPLFQPLGGVIFCDPPAHLAGDFSSVNKPQTQTSPLTE
jgi:hypothetical protein